MKSRRYRLGFMILVGLGTPLASLAQTPPAQPTHPPPPITTPLPTGPFSSWPEEDREPAIRHLRVECVMTATMVFAATPRTGPKEALIQDMLAFTSACLDKLMPDDWPGHAAERAQKAIHYEAAIRLDPQMPDPDPLVSGFKRWPP